jgi:hypothetical protein
LEESRQLIPPFLSFLIFFLTSPSLLPLFQLPFLICTFILSPSTIGLCHFSSPLQLSFPFWDLVFSGLSISDKDGLLLTLS